ncbi:MAG TPA: hypothetical protein PK098_07305 [Phycisphaerales bacterium]|nr:hypothetical protein [Phycisphaerales bacterium]
MKTITNKLTAALAFGAWLLPCVSMAHAQDALGRGDVLDANPGRTSGGRNLPSQVENFRARNLIVTGDVAGGRGFRGTVGYGADSDFRGVLGSDDLFDFRARSFLSSPQMLQYGGAAQQFSLGQQLGLLEYRREPMPTGVGGFGNPLLQGGAIGGEPLPPTPAELSIRVDAITMAASGRALESRAEPKVIGVMQGPEGVPSAVTISTLQGFVSQPVELMMAKQSYTTLDQLRLEQDFAAGRLTTPAGTPFEGRFQSLALDQRIDPGRQFDPAGRDETGEYARLLERIVDRYANLDNVQLHIDQQVLNQLDDRFADLRKKLIDRERERLARLAMPGAGVTQPEEEDAAALPGAAPRPTDAAEPETRDPLDIGDITPLLRHGQRVDQLSGTMLTRFNEMMALAEESLRRGDYFIAERRFNRALRFTPGHPLAIAGLAHSQIGAGLNASASLILQRLFIEHPEMIDTRFGPNVLPDQARLRQVMQSLEPLPPRGSRDSASSAFLLAYLGHQLGERAVVERGLKAMRDAAPDSALLPVLEAVWLDEGTAQPTTAPNKPETPEASEVPPSK